ncbi:GTPase-associated system all-helical protein GASH [Candidatus Palauibacter sp.]|uniref:GTPase-associated system all-helical protein GASH n=1 Tax=Candidatus Palauibacter sp. TaxID=3101350 RepID=UPI003B523606
MQEDVLLRFLGRGLIDVGGDDDKLGHLRQTAVDLSEVLRETPAKATPFALVAFDPDVPNTDPTIIQVKDTLRSRWETYVNTFSGTPVTVLRAILLEALVRACEQDDVVAVAFVATARNVLPFTEADGEQEIWTETLLEIERRVEERAQREWATPASISIPDHEFDPPSAVEIRIRSKKTSDTTLRPKFEAAAGPHSTDPNGSQTDTSGNPHWPNNNGDWVHEFGTRTAQAVAEAINRAIGGLSVEGGDLPGIAREMMAVMSEHLTATLRAVSDASAGLQRRTTLLWWKEALFSTSAGVSYREMSTSDAAALMAFDMYRHIPTFSPASVAAFLRETVIALPTMDQEQEIPIRELVEMTYDAGVLDELRTEASRLVAAPEGRGSILGLIGHPEAVAQINHGRFRNLVGVQSDTMLTLPHWSVWILRELQAARAIAESSAPKRRTSNDQTSSE